MFKHGVVLVVALLAFGFVVARYLHGPIMRQPSARVPAMATAHKPAAGSLSKVAETHDRDMSWSPDVGAPAAIKKDALLCPSQTVLSNTDKAVAKASAANDSSAFRHALYKSLMNGCSYSTHFQQGRVTEASDSPEPMYQVRLPDGHAYWVDLGYLQQPHQGS